MLVHATTLDIAGCGVLLLGEPGAGKSDLALRLIGDGALLVSDDQTLVEARDGGLHACAPSPIVGLIEVRGVGIARAAIKRATCLALAVQLVDSPPERMPERRSWSLPGHPTPAIPLIDMMPFEASAPAKLRTTLAFVPNA